MSALLDVLAAHPAGECFQVPPTAAGAWPVDTPGGRFYAEWDSDTPVTRDGQLVFFFQFLHSGGRWRQLMERCPLHYTGNRGSGAHNVMGTLFLSVLNGHWRYAHINGVRGDGVNPYLLGMECTVSEDTVRAALKRINESDGLRWLRREVLDTIAPVLELPWILDIDTTVKPLYGHQQGAEIGYNPHKHGRPSHVYHSYFVAGPRMSLGVEVQPGKKHAAARGLPGLWETLEQLPRSRWPTLARGDCAYGNEAVLHEFEQHGLPYLFKLKHTAKVKTLVKMCLLRSEVWTKAGEGWEVAEAELRLTGWRQRRRVVLVREAPARAPVAEQARRRRDHLGAALEPALPGAEGEGWSATPAPWSGRIAVLVTSLDRAGWPAAALARLYRERADAENAFDELKNQWGWNGFMTRQLGPCRLMANFIALTYNWWNLYVRFYDEEHHREAITSRPALMQGVARQVRSGGQRCVKVSLQHEKGEAIARAVTLISSQLQTFQRITERWPVAERWACLLNRLFRRWLGGKWLPGVRPRVALLFSG